MGILNFNAALDGSYLPEEDGLCRRHLALARCGFTLGYFLGCWTALTRQLYHIGRHETENMS